MKLCAILLMCCSFLSAQAPKPKEPLEFTKIAEGVYAQIVSPDSNAVSNSGIVVLDHAVLVFDSHFTPEAGQDLASKFHSITPHPIRYVINSHFHPDHTHGNQAFPGAEIISSTNGRRDVLQSDLPSLNRSLAAAQSQLEKMQKELLRESDPAKQGALRSQIAGRRDFVDRMAKLKIVAPQLTFEDRMSLTDGPRRVELIYLGPGHTDGDIVLFLPTEKVVFAGDLFFNAALPNTQDANMLDWMTAVEALLKLDAEKFVPGHGVVGTKKDVQEFLSYFTELKSVIEPRVAHGDTLEQVIRETALPARFSGYKFQNFFPSNVQKMYEELKKLQPVSPAEGPQKPEPVKARP